MHRVNPTAFPAALSLAIAALWSPGCASSSATDTQPRTEARPEQGVAPSRVIVTEANQRILAQEVVVNAPIQQVWDAYTTAEGWTAWAVPAAEVDLRVGGEIRTSYTGQVGDPGTNVLKILSYVPRRLLSLRATSTENWPEVMKHDADRLSNVILFEQLEDGRTRVESYGIGYSDAPEYESMMQFFIDANERLHANLTRYLEEGERVDWGQ